MLLKATDGQTIAIPALGTGMYNIPHDVSAKSLVTATNEFLQENPSHALREVHFVDNDPTAIEALMKEMSTRFRHDLNFQINALVRDGWRSFLGAARVTPPTGSIVSIGENTLKTLVTSPMHDLNEYLRRTMQCRYTYPNGKIIEVHQGDILEHPADFLVNSANDELKHSGGLPKAIVDKGGQKIQDDCKRYLEDQGIHKLTPTDVVATGGGNLKCKQVLHVVVPKNKSIPGEHEGETPEGLYLR